MEHVTHEIAPELLADPKTHTQYPTFLYHQTEAPDGKYIKTVEAWPSGTGWVDSPAKFDPDYVAPPNVEDGTLPREAALAGYVPQLFPLHLYRKGDPDQPLEVKSREHLAELEATGKYVPGLYRESPDPKHKCWLDAPAPPAPAAPIRPTLDVPTPEQVEKRKAALFGQTVDQVAADVAKETDVAVLQVAREYETANPRGARQGVYKAIDKRIAELTPPTA